MIGGSEAAAAVGLDPFKSRVRLWLEKTGQIESEPAGEAAEWGNLLQPLIAEAVARRGYDVIPAPADAVPCLEWPIAQGHLDGYAVPAGTLGERGVFEAKTCGLRMARLWQDEAVPVPYQIQVQHYMACTGLSWALVACLVGGQKLEIRHVARDDDLIAMLIEGEQEFWSLVESGTPPAPDGSPDATAMLGRMYPEARGHVLLTAADMELVHKRRAMKRAEKALAQQLEAVEQAIKMRLGSAEVGLYEARPIVRWGNVKSKRLNEKALRAALPSIFEEFCQESAYRRFTVV